MHSQSSTDYAAFIDRKRVTAPAVGFSVELAAINPKLFPFQRTVVQWALARGRAALFEDCGLGKGFQQIEWARIVAERTGKPVIIFAPLAVAQQTVREGEKLGVPVRLVREEADVGPGSNVTNYDRLHLFPDPTRYGGIVLDESSLLKGFDGYYRKQLTDYAKAIDYRLCCTATPAPNDIIEIANHSEFLDVMTGKEVIALFFTQDGNTTHAFRLKGHAKTAFWTWMASWSVAIRKPSDIGFSDDGFRLPKLTNIQHIVASPNYQAHTLFAVEALTMEDRRRARQASIADRVAKCAELVNASDEQWLVWCDLNAESHALAKAIPDAVEVTGSDSVEHKERAVLDFVSGKQRVLVSKPSIFGFGLNLQNCARMAFVGLSDSWEQIYQATRRCWRFGQERPVEVHIITAEAEGAVVKNIERKERQATEMMAQIVRHMGGLQLDQSSRNELDYRPAVPMAVPVWLKDMAA